MNTLFNNKKGSDGDTYVAQEKPFKFIIFIILIGAVLIAFLTFGINYMDSLAYVDQEMEAELMIQRMQNVCFAYKNPDTGVYSENTIDYTKFNRTMLDKCFQDNNTPAMIITLRPLMEEPQHKDDFKPRMMKTGAGSTAKEYVKYTIVRTEDEVYPAELRVKI
ncbi:MAG: hypothetical protein ACLFTH_00140 [Candidatus Woesearchaeota archaeon]